MNTGYIGEGENSKDIRVIDTVNILKALNNNVEWEFRPELSYEIPKEMKNLNIEFNPKEYYDKDEFEEKIRELREERKKWLMNFQGLNSEITNAVY